MNERSRRAFLHGGASAAALLMVGACRDRNRVLVTAGPEPRPSTSPSTSADPAAKKPEVEEPEVTATEDMMREHGVLRRALVVYAEAAKLLRADVARVRIDALQQTAKLFRTFGEDYHEKKLEEAHVFPALKKAGGPNAELADVLVAQHERGREITDYILSVTAAPKVGAKATELASVLEGFVRMYDSHTAREDTIVFPAWKKTLTSKELDEMGDKFEAIEHAQFGGDGFDLALKQMETIESELGLADLSRFTASRPPKSA